MKLARNLSLSLEILAAHKLRTLLSVTGVVVGVGAVVVMVAAGRGAERALLEGIRAMGTNLILVSAGQTRIVAGRARQTSTVTTLMPEDGDAISARCASVVRVAPVQSKKLAVRFEDTTVNTTILGTTPEGLSIRNIEFASGRSFYDAEERALARVAVVGPTVERELFAGVDPVGARVRVGRVPFEVIGATAPRGLDLAGVDQDDIIFIPLRTAMRRVLNVPHVQSLYVQVRSAERMWPAEEEVRMVLRERHRLGDKPDDFTIQNQLTLLEAERETSRSLTLLIGSVAAISLFVGGVGILAVMLIAVRERTTEIGLRRALGARRSDIRLQFVVESVLVAGVGGVLGIASGALVARLLVAATRWQMEISWPVTVLALVFSCGLGVVFGLYPAVRAAELEPIAALRAE